MTFIETSGLGIGDDLSSRFLPPEQEAPESQQPLRSFVLSIVGVCNFNCPECTVFNLADDSLLAQNQLMSDKVLETTTRQIGEYVVRQGLAANGIAINLFGGEPTLGGAGHLQKVLSTIRGGLGEETNIAITTNGVGLGKPRRGQEIREVLKGVRMAISLDGPQKLHDKYRPYSGGRGTFDDTVRGIQAWNDDNPDNHAGILVTLHDPRDPDNDPAEVYEIVKSLSPRAFDVLLNNKLNELPQLNGRHEITETTSTPYGDYLAALYDIWMDDPTRPPMRLFDETHRLLRGEATGSSVVGTAPMVVVGVSPKGYIELDSSYYGTANNMAATGVTVFNDKPFDRVARHRLVSINQKGKEGLSAACRACTLVEVCGGGLAVHRYRPEPSGNPRLSEIEQLFDWPSRYCQDLSRFLLHVIDKVDTPIARQLREN